MDNPSRGDILEIGKELGYDAVVFIEVIDGDLTYDTDHLAIASGSSRIVVKSVDGGMLVDGAASTEFASGEDLHLLIRKQLVKIIEQAAASSVPCEKLGCTQVSFIQ